MANSIANLDIHAPSDESLDQRRLVLPAGVFDAAGRAHRCVRVRELTGADEEALFDRSSTSTNARRVSEFLARAIESVEGLDEPVDAAFADRMQIGDRDYLLLRLRQMELGDAVHQVVRCPACARRVDVDLSISELPVRRLPEPTATHRVRLAGAELLLRLPTGADQAAVAELALGNPAAANTRLFARLVLDVDGHGPPDEAAVRAWPIALRARLAAWLEANTPGPDLFLELDCPNCQADMSYAFDLDAFFLPSV